MTSATETATLVTFFLYVALFRLSPETAERLLTDLSDSAPATQYIDLYGSWDAFSRPYAMKKDRQTGHGRWSGCHRFKDIVCDGDPSVCKDRREGCLVTGGTYWYYYKLNDDLEYHDPLKPSTSNCPLLPGQRVNVLHIPLQTSTPQDSVDGNHHSMTLDPADRTKRLRPPPSAGFLDSITSTIPFPDDEDVHREEYMRKSLGRLQTAAAHLLVLAFLGHSLPGRQRNEEHNRPATMVEKRPKQHHVAAATKPSSRKWLHGLTEHHLPRMTLDGGDRHKGTFRATEDAVPDAFPNPFLGGRQREAAHRFQERCYILHGQRSPTRPLSDSYTVRSGQTVRRSRRPSTAPVSPAPSNPGCQEQTDVLGVSNAHHFGDLRLRIACAKLRASQGNQTLSDEDSSWVLGQAPRPLANPTGRILMKPKGSKDISEQESTSTQAHDRMHRPNRHSLHAWTPETRSPSLEEPRFWGSPDCDADCISPNSPATIYYSELTRSRTSMRYSLGGAGIGLNLTEEIGSQETIKPPRPPSRSKAASETLLWKFPDYVPESLRVLAVDRTGGNDDLIKDLNYLGSAIV